jgi:SSS family solute:Na+ symporter
MVLTIVVAYLVLMLGVGWWWGRTRITGMTDFILAGRRLGFVLCAGAMAATHFGGGALMGGAREGYERGLSGAWYGMATGVGLMALGLFTARRFRALALYTIPDYLAQRYGGKTIRLLGATLSLAAMIGIMAAQITAAGSAFTILGFDATWAAVVAAAVFVAYTALGGLWAATISDAIQISIASAGVFLAAAIVLSRSGGHIFAAAPPDHDGYGSLWGAGPGYVLWLLIPTVMYTLIGQDFYQRLFAAQSPSIARRASLAGGVFLVLVSLLPALVGAGARTLSGGLERSELALPWVLQNLFSPMAGGLFLAAILAATMSTADSLLTAATSHVVKDIWVESIHEGRSRDERELLRISRVVTVVTGAVALAIALASPGIVSTLIYSYTLYTAGVFVPVLGGVVWRRATKPAAITAVLGGCITAVFGILTHWHVAGIPTEVYAALVSAVLFVGVGWAVPPRGDRLATAR